MRYTPWVIALVSSVAAFALASALLIVALSQGRTDGLVLLAVALGLLSFLAAAFTLGRIRRTRSLTPEAIISPPPADDGPI